MSKIINIKGKDYLILGQRLLEIERYEEKNGKKVPIIKVDAKEIKNDDGTQDVKIKVPYLTITGGK